MLTNIEDLHSFSSVFIKYTSPTMCSIKPSNLFSVPVSLFSNQKVQFWKNNLRKNGIDMRYFKISKDRIQIFSFNVFWVQEILKNQNVKNFLESKNYDLKGGLQNLLGQLFKRVLTAQNFPHEIGIFLGYPLEDVILFEKQNGKNCKYCGCWKSYSNAEEAKSCCCKYKQCSEFCLAGYKNGLPIQQVIENYKKIFVKQESAISA